MSNLLNSHRIPVSEWLLGVQANLTETLTRLLPEGAPHRIETALGATNTAKIAIDPHSLPTVRATVYLPQTLKIDGFLSQRLADTFAGFCLHELGHALHTRPSAPFPPELQRKAGVLEDLRIERLLLAAAALPNAKTLLSRTANWVLAETEARVGKTRSEFLPRDFEGFVCYKGRETALGLELGLAEAAAATPRQAALAGKLWAGVLAATCADDVVALAREWLREEQAENERTSPEERAGGNKPGNGSGAGSGAGPEDGSGAGSGAGSEAGSKAGSEAGPGAGSEAGPGNGPEGGDGGVPLSLAPRLPESPSADADAARKNGHALRVALSLNRSLPKVEAKPRYRLPPDVLPPGAPDTLASRAGLPKSSRGLVAHLRNALIAPEKIETREFQTRGRLSRRGVARLAVQPDTAFARRRHAPGWDTAVAILLDGSESMKLGPRSSRIAAAEAASRLIAQAVEEIGCRCLMGTFRSGREGRIDFPIDKPLDRPLKACPWRPDMKKASGGTPLSPVLIEAGNMLAGAKETKKVILTLTDGECNFRREGVELALRYLARRGIDCVAIGVGSYMPSASFKLRLSCPDVRTLADAGLKSLAAVLKASRTP
jgi:hypothetical protein